MRGLMMPDSNGIRNLIYEEPKTDREREFLQFTKNINMKYHKDGADDAAFKQLRKGQKERRRLWPDLDSNYLAGG
jgi:hypothetical protein